MTGFVYFVRAIEGVGPIKIGHSTDPLRRLREIANWSPYSLEIVYQILGSQQLERNLHNCFADDHSHGEWFRASTRLEFAIHQMQNGVPVHQAIDLTDIRGNVLFMTAEATRIRNGSALPWAARRTPSPHMEKAA